MIILIRHGQTTTNARRLLVGRSDPELTELLARGQDPSFQNKVHLAMDAKGFGPDADDDGE